MYGWLLLVGLRGPGLMEVRPVLWMGLWWWRREVRGRGEGRRACWRASETSGVKVLLLMLLMQQRLLLAL